MGAFLRNSFAHVDNVIPVVKTINHMAAPVKVARQQTPPELSGTFRTLPPEPTPTRAGTLRNPPAEPSEPCLRNLHQHAPELFGTLRNLPELASGTYHFTPELSGTLPEPASGTYTSRRRNSPELSGTFLRNLLLQPAPAHTGAYLGWRPH